MNKSLTCSRHLKVYQYSYTASFSKSLFQWVNLMFNRVSKDRIKEVGPDHACAEWLLRNGAHIKWKGLEGFVEDYNDLPLDGAGHRKGNLLHVSSVHAKNASIMANGFPHFNGCQYIESIILQECYLLSNAALPFLQSLEGSLKYLEINSCPNISDEGLLSLTQLRNLELLRLKNLPAVKDKEFVKEKLQNALPRTKLLFNGNGK